MRGQREKGRERIARGVRRARVGMKTNFRYVRRGAGAVYARVKARV